MKILAIVQARMGSGRLPGKILMPLGCNSAIEFLLKRLSKSKNIDYICIATSIDYSNNKLCDKLKHLGFDYYRGSEDDVLSRFYEASQLYDADIIVRITGDCPLVDPYLVDNVINLFLSKKVDYVSNIFPPTYPDGLDVEVFSKHSLHRAYKEATLIYDREHVTPYLRSGKFKTLNFNSENNFSNLRITLDYTEDLEVITHIIKNFSPNLYFGYEEVIKFLLDNQNINNLNSKYSRNKISNE